MTPESWIGGGLAAAGLVWRLAFPHPSVEIEFWQGVTFTGAAFLAVGLVRDVLILLLAKRTCPPKRAGEKTICLESLVGPLLVFAGLGILGAGVHHAFRPPLPSVGIYLGLLFIVSGRTKDVVVVFRREPNHMNVIPW
jgi:hypothetical protein